MEVRLSRKIYQSDRQERGHVAVSLRQIFVEICGAAKLEFIDPKDKLVKIVLHMVQQQIPHDL